MNSFEMHIILTLSLVWLVSNIWVRQANDRFCVKIIFWKAFAYKTNINFQNLLFNACIDIVTKWGSYIHLFEENSEPIISLVQKPNYLCTVSIACFLW